MPDRLGASTVASLFAHTARRRGARPCLVDARGVRTYAQVVERVAKLAGVLRSRGVLPGDRVALLSSNRAEALELVLATLWLGAVVAPQSAELAPVQLEHCLQITEPRLIVAPRREAGRVLYRIEPVLAFGDAFDAELADTAPVPVVEVAPDEPALLLFSSPTRGVQHGVAISHATVWMRDLAWRAAHGLRNEDGFVLAAPLAHVGGLEPALGTLLAGGCVHLLDGFVPAEVAALLGRVQVGWLPVPPGQVGELVHELEVQQVQVVGVRLCGQLADAVAPQRVVRLSALLRAPFADTFASAELGLAALASQVEPGSRGRSARRWPSPYVEVKVVDAEGVLCPAGQPGELCVRGPLLFSGYWGEVEATAEAFRGGWYHTGHPFVAAADGSVQFVDPQPYEVHTGGEAFSPNAVEQALLALPSVYDVAVVARPDTEWGSVPVAVVASDDPELSVARLRGAASALPAHQRPRDVVIVEPGTIPRSASGLLQRELLEQLLRAS